MRWRPTVPSTSASFRTFRCSSTRSCCSTATIRPTSGSTSRSSTTCCSCATEPPKPIWTLSSSTPGTASRRSSRTGSVSHCSANEGAGLGKDFAHALHGALGDIFRDFGKETVTRGTHLEKLCLIRAGVGKDNISDFTANLIKAFLCEYTQTFARQHIDPKHCQEFAVPRARFNYDTRTWVTERYHLPRLFDDFVLLTPVDILTRDETWINYSDMVSKFRQLPDAVANTEQRANINQYFERVLGERPTAKETREAAAATIRRFPELIDLYIKLQEDTGDYAEAISADKVEDTHRALVEQIRQAVVDVTTRTDFFDKPWTS
jgi:hypothetical protein